MFHKLVSSCEILRGIFYSCRTWSALVVAAAPENEVAEKPSEIRVGERD
jgi:hypothetical protein